MNNLHIILVLLCAIVILLLPLQYPTFKQNINTNRPHKAGNKYEEVITTNNLELYPTPKMVYRKVEKGEKYLEWVKSKVGFHYSKLYIFI